MLPPTENPEKKHLVTRFLKNFKRTQIFESLAGTILFFEKKLENADLALACSSLLHAASYLFFFFFFWV